MCNADRVVAELGFGGGLRHVALGGMVADVPRRASLAVFLKTFFTKVTPHANPSTY